MDMTTVSTPELAQIIAQASAELARRASGASAAEPVQPALFDGFEPIDPELVDRDERLLDGSRRWLAPKEAAALLRLDEDSVIRRVKRDGIGIQIGGRYLVDVTRVKGRK